MWEITRSNRARFIRKCLAFPPFGGRPCVINWVRVHPEVCLSYAATEPLKSQRGHQHLMRKGPSEGGSPRFRYLNSLRGPGGF